MPPTTDELAAMDEEQLWEAAEAKREEIRAADADTGVSAAPRAELTQIEIERQRRRIASYRGAIADAEEGPERDRLAAKLVSAEDGLARMERGEMPPDGRLVDKIG